MTSMPGAAESVATASVPNPRCVSRLAGLSAAPVVVSPSRVGQEVTQFATEYGAWLKSELHRAGAVLFRGFAAEYVDGF